MFRPFAILATLMLLLAFGPEGIAQNFQIKGTVRNGLTSKPIADANIRIYGTSLGTATGRSGQFSLQLPAIPSTLIVSCIGFETSRIEIMEFSDKPFELTLKPTTYSLSEVRVSAAQQKILYQDKSYSVLDYELLDDNILLLVFRTVLKRSELVLMSRSGDTLAVAEPPGLPPSMLYRDFLLNVHFYSRDGYSWQCYYNKENHQLGFLDPTPVDTLERYLRPFLFRISGRLYFQEKTVNGFGTSIGYYSKDSGKVIIKACVYEKKISEYFDDQRFYLGFNSMTGTFDVADSGQIGSPSEFDFSISSSEGGAYGKNERRAQKFEFYNMIFPLVNLGNDNMAFFNFGADMIEIINPDGRTLRTVPISFHREASSKDRQSGSKNQETTDWRWGTKILTDGYTHDPYTIFLKNGQVKVRKIDLSTGSLDAGTVLPYLFPEKIQVYRGEAYFLCKESTNGANWKLVKCRLD